MQFRSVSSRKTRNIDDELKAAPRCLRSRRSRMTVGSIPPRESSFRNEVCGPEHLPIPAEPTSRIWKSSNPKGAFDIVTEYMRENSLQCQSKGTITRTHGSDQTSKIKTPDATQSDENASLVKSPYSYRLRHSRVPLKEYRMCEDANNASDPVPPKTNSPLKAFDLNMYQPQSDSTSTSESASSCFTKCSNPTGKSNEINSTIPTNCKLSYKPEPTNETSLEQPSLKLTQKRPNPGTFEIVNAPHTDPNGKSPRLNNVHTLMDSTAKVGLDISQNRSLSNQSVLSTLSALMRSSNVELSSGTTARSAAHKTRRSTLLHDSKVKRKPARTTSSSLLERPRPSSAFQFRATMTSESLLPNKHPFLHHWEREQSRPIENGWRSRRNAYLTILLATHDSLTDSAASATSDDCKLRSSEKRPLAPRRDYMPYYHQSEDDKVVSNEVAFQDRAISEFEPLLLGYRWILGSEPCSSEIELHNKSVAATMGSEQCESMLLWN